MKYFLTYSKKDDCVWGIGHTKKESLTNSLEQIIELGVEKPADLRTVECDEELYNSLYADGWNFQEILVSGRKAFLQPVIEQYIREI